jgi:hypothetical protein
MADGKKLNSAKGRDSFDAEIDGAIIPFFNRNVTPYPTEAGGPKFDLVPVTKQKDIMLNNARHFAKQEYNRIMELVAVLEKQAQDIKRRLDVTDAVHAAEYQFQLSVGLCYWLVWHKRHEKTILVHLGPNDWATGTPEDYDYITRVKFLGDHTWEEVDEN